MGLLHSGSIITDGLVLCLDAANPRSYPQTGSTWYDLSGKNNHVTLYNSILFDSNSKTLYGDGTNAYARTINTLDLSLFQSITVISIWKSNSNGNLLYEHTNNWNVVNNNYGGFGIATNSNGSTSVTNLNHAQLRGNVGYAGVNAASPDTIKYQFYTIVHDFSKAGGEESYAYVNGNYIAKSSQPSSGASYNNDNTGNFENDYFYLWSRGGASSFNTANISLLMIYTRSLSLDEIRQNFNATRGRFNI